MSIILSLNINLYRLDFTKQAMEDVEKLNEKCKSTVEAIDGVAIHFGEDVKKFVVEECFTLLANFFERIDAVAKVR